MTETVQVKRIEVSVRRDAGTITTTQIAEHELPLLQVIHGKENVTEVGDIAPFDLVPEDEYLRMCTKYGTEAVEKVFGQDDGIALAKKIRNQVTAAAKKAAPEGSSKAAAKAKA